MRSFPVRRLVTLLLLGVTVSLLVAGCVGAAVAPVKGAMDVRVLKEAPPAGGTPLTVLKAVHGDGCGWLGSLGDYEGALGMLRNQAVAAGANYVQITGIHEPYSDGECRHNEYIIEGTAYRVSADALPPPGAEPALGEKAARPITADAVKSLCGTAALATKAGFNLPTEPCDYLLAIRNPSPKSAITLSAKLLGKSRYGVLIGGLVSGLFNGFGVQYDSAESGLRFVRRTAGKKLVAPLKKIPTDERFHDWRVAQTGRRVLVWFDDQLVASEPAPSGEHHVTLQTEKGAVEIRNAQAKPIESKAAAELDSVEAVAWGDLAPESPVNAAPEHPSTAPEPVAAALPAAVPTPTLATLREYYGDVNAGRFSAGRYFASKVVRFIGMHRTTPAAIDRYMHDVFPTQFRDVTFEMDESTLREEGASGFTYTEHANYFNVVKGDNEALTSTARVQFDKDARLTQFYQARVLEHLTGEAARNATFPAVAAGAAKEGALPAKPRADCDDGEWLGGLSAYNGRSVFDLKEPCFEKKLDARLGKKKKAFDDNSSGPGAQLSLVDGVLMGERCRAHFCAAYYAAYGVDTKTGDVSAAIIDHGKIEWIAGGSKPPAPFKRYVEDLARDARAMLSGN